ncbi:MAG: hypothetical protein WA004_05615 [Saprospiraceae bacterium]
MLLYPFKPGDLLRLMGKTSTPAFNQNHFILKFFEFDGSPNEISLTLNLIPSEISSPHEKGFWSQDIRKDSNYMLGDLLHDYLNEVILPRKELIKKITRKCSVARITIVQYNFHTCNPGLFINATSVKLLAEINTELDIDFYCLADTNLNP